MDIAAGSKECRLSLKLRIRLPVGEGGRFERALENPGLADLTLPIVWNSRRGQRPLSRQGVSAGGPSSPANIHTHEMDSGLTSADESA